jgi:hypothetical protein
MNRDKAEIQKLNTRLEELEKAHGFIEMYYTLRAAERLDEWAKTHENLGEAEAEGLRLASQYLREMAEEATSSPLPPAEIT